MIFLLIMFIVSQIMLSFRDDVTNINIIIDNQTYNMSEYRIDNESLPYLQYQCIQSCMDNIVDSQREFNCMKTICLELGKK